MAWAEFAEQRKHQVAEYHVLQREYQFNQNTITLLLTNPIEEPLLLSLKSELLTFLREKLSNNALQIESLVQQIQSRRIAYTNKEKFDYLAEKNPLLNELKDRMGLDPDF